MIYSPDFAVINSRLAKKIKTLFVRTVKKL